MRVYRFTLSSLVLMCASICALAIICAPAIAASPPAVSEVSFSNVGSSSATLTAQVAPEGADTTYRFEYGTGTAYGLSLPVPDGSAGLSTSPVSVLVNPQSLMPSTEYHFRVIASNIAGTTSSPDMTFSTLPAGILGLPDGRVYEMVTPVNNHNADVYVDSNSSGNPENGVFTELPFQAASDGNAVAYSGSPTVGGNGSDSSGGGNEYLATRSSTGGWTQTNLQPAGSLHVAYEAFSGNLSIGILDSCAREPLVPGVPGNNNILYTRDNSDGSYHPLITTDPPNRGPYELKSAGGIGVSSLYCEPLNYAGGSSDSRHILFNVNDALTPEASDGGPTEDNLYDSVDGELNLVNVLPDGTSKANAVFGAQGNLSRVISSSGNLIFWTDLSTGTLYVRENDATPAAQTIEISSEARYQTANADGSVVFYIRGGDLYALDLKDNRVGTLTSGGEVQGTVGVGDAGTYVYFVADAALAADAIAGQPNLYLRRFDGAAWTPTTFIATLAPGDGGVGSSLGYRTSEVSSDGHSVVFMSAQSLTKYQGGGAPQVYVYEADEKRIFCASCSASSEPPTEGGTLPISYSNTYLPHWMSSDGARVFFQTSQPLVSQDTNGNMDVYEWEREGAGSCKEAQGCQYLISGGQSTAASWLLDASANGNDVFMTTRAQLLPQDQNDNYNIFDARVDGVKEIVPPGCVGSGCQGVPPGQPVFATPSSVTFTGVGNFVAQHGTTATIKSRPLTRAALKRAIKACQKRYKRRKRTTCETHARAKYRVSAGTKRSTTRRK